MDRAGVAGHQVALGIQGADGERAGGARDYRRGEAGDGQAARDIAYGDGDRSHIAVRSSIIRHVRECIGAGERRIRRIGERAVTIERHSSIGWCAHQNRGERIAIRIGVIRENSRRSDDRIGTESSGVKHHVGEKPAARRGFFFVHQFEQGRDVRHLGIALSRSLQQQANKTFFQPGKIGFAAKKSCARHGTALHFAPLERQVLFGAAGITRDES